MPTIRMTQDQYSVELPPPHKVRAGAIVDVAQPTADRFIAVGIAEFAEPGAQTDRALKLARLRAEAERLEREEHLAALDDLEARAGQGVPPGVFTDAMLRDQSGSRDPSSMLTGERLAQPSRRQGRKGT